MRWKVTTKTDIKDINETQSKKTTTVTRSQYITVGDIVGAGKSAAGAVQKLVKTLPIFINNLRNNPKDQAIAIGVNNIAQPLAVIMSGMDGYKKIMGVIDTLTPIMKTVARASGVWCSPGNVSDMAQIVLGTVQQILISILTSSILRLKEMIWNYEFNIKNISDSTSLIITKNLKKYNDNNKDIALDKDIFNNDKNDPQIKDILNQYNESKNNLNNIIDHSYKEPPISIDMDTIIDILTNDVNNSEEKKCSRRSNYVTKFFVGDGTYKRILSGSLDDNGIYFSDDNGKTWEKTSQVTGCFNSFSSIEVLESGKNKIIYVAGSTEKIKNLSKTPDKTFSKDSDGHYNKDYYKKNYSKYSKKEKDLLNGEMEFVNDKTDFSKSDGILYSDDNGITWNSSNIKEGLFERIHLYNDKDSPSRLVASSYDYKGLYYSEDGKVWNNCILNNHEIITGRWILLEDIHPISPKISSLELNNINKFNISIINTIENVNNFSINMNTTLNKDFYQGEGFDDFTKDDKKIRNILNYIHRQYAYKLPDYDEIFWDKLIQDIKNNKYTLNDAINGERL